MNEEIKIRVGMDATPMAAAMRTAKGQLEDWGKNIVSSFKSYWSGLFAVGTVAKAMSEIKSAIDDAEQLGRRAASLGVSQGFVQDLRNLGLAAGVSEEEITKMLEQMEKKMKPGESPEQAFWRLADSIAAIKDPTEKAQVAFESFGKSAFAMIALTKDGSQSLKDLAGSFAKLSDQELAKLQEADAILDKLENRYKVWKARAIVFAVENAGMALANLVPGGRIVKGAFDMLPGNESGAGGIDYAKQEEASRIKRIRDAQLLLDREIGAFEYAQKTTKQKRESLETFQGELASQISATDKDEERLGLITSMWKIQGDIAELRKKEIEEEKKITDEKKKQRDESEKTIRAQRDKWVDSIGNQAQQLSSSAQFTLEDLAGQRFNPRGAMAANQIMQLRQFAKMNMMTFNPAAMDLGRKQLTKADEIMQSMSNENPFLVNPMSELIRTSTEQRDALQALLQAAAGGSGGIVVQAKD